MSAIGYQTGLLGGAAALALVAAGPALAETDPGLLEHLAATKARLHRLAAAPRRPVAAADETAAIRRHIDSLMDRLARLEADKSAKRKVAAAAAVEAGDKPRSWKLPGTNTSMSIGGFVKLIAVYDLGGNTARNGLEARDAGGGFGLSNLPGSALDNRLNGGHLNITARRTRFWIQTWTPTEWGELRTYLEFDFASSNADMATGPGTSEAEPRLRQAYGVLGPVLMGQTTNTFYNAIGAMETLNDGGLLGANSWPGARRIRIGMIRYTHDFGGGTTAELAVEQPISDTILAVAGATGATGGARVPAFVAALQHRFARGAIRASAVLKQVNLDNAPGAVGGAPGAASLWGYGGSVAGRFAITPRWEIGGTGYWGVGIGSYTAVTADGVTRGGTATGDFGLVQGWGAQVWTQVKLTDTIRAAAGFGGHWNGVKARIPGATTAAKEALITGTINQEYAAIGNLIWSPVPQVDFGIEYFHMWSQPFATANFNSGRVQFSAIYRF